jgi:putative spermidine/putrescine transport system ATP-binding protein
MIGVEIKELTKRFGGFLALDAASLTVPLGQFVCFLGPSGCGKTTLLRLIAGLESPDSGQILLNGKDITREPAHRRQFGMVFQSLALFPHLSVADNIAYSLRLKGRTAAERKARVEELLTLIRLPGVGRRSIGQLSGGQRQRVAIARALAQEPAVFLLDEPLSALDAKLREEMQVELRLLQQQLEITTILVTHDQREAMTMADIVVVMSQGRIQQIGRPIDIYRQPANRFVANFFGLSNLIPAEVTGRAAIRFGAQEVAVGLLPESVTAGQAVTLSIRPEDIRLRPWDGGGTGLTGEIVFIRDLGGSVEVRIDCAGQHLTSVVTPRDWPGGAPADRLLVEFPPECCRVLTE